MFTMNWPKKITKKISKGTGKLRLETKQKTFSGLWQERWSTSQSTIITLETTFLQQKQQKQHQTEVISFDREEILRLKVCMLNTQPTYLMAEFQAGKTKQHIFDWKLNFRYWNITNGVRSANRTYWWPGTDSYCTKNEIFN